MATTEQIKTLRDKTGVSVMQCKKALEEAGGDMDRALALLKKKGGEIVAKKSDRELGAGIIAAYVHSNKTVGVLVELACETDFVAQNEAFVQLGHDIALHIAGMYPVYVRNEDISPEDREKARELFEKEVEESGKPEEIKQKMMEGKLASYFKDRVLLEQNYVKNPDITVADLITDAVQKFGERIEVVRFTHYTVGGE